MAIGGAGIAQWLERMIRDRKVAGSKPGRIKIKKFTRVNFPCWLLFRYPFHLRVTAVARPFCQKCRWHVTAEHLYTLRVWLCMKWRDMVIGSMVYIERAEPAAVSHGSSHVTTEQRCKYPTKKLVVHLEPHATRVQWVCLRVEDSAIYTNDLQQ